MESPVIMVGNGGENIVWNPAATSHEGHPLRGRMDRPAYDNDMENMQAALQSLYGAAPIAFKSSRMGREGPAGRDQFGLRKPRCEYTTPDAFHRSWRFFV